MATEVHQIPTRLDSTIQMFFQFRAICERQQKRFILMLSACLGYDGIAPALACLDGPDVPATPANTFNLPLNYGTSRPSRKLYLTVKSKMFRLHEELFAQTLSDQSYS